MIKARYQVKMRKNKKGNTGSTQYGFSTKIKAVIFAAGYQAALHDVGRTDLYVSVWDNGNYMQPKPTKQLIMDTDQLKEIAAREF